MQLADRSSRAAVSHASQAAQRRDDLVIDHDTVIDLRDTAVADPSAPDGVAFDPTIPPDVRKLIQARRLARPAPRSALQRIAGIVVAWAALGTFGVLVDRLWAWAVVWTLLPIALVGCNPVMHESIHHNNFRSRRTNHLVGSLAGAVLGMHGPAFRSYHLTHHANTFTERDSEQLPAAFRSRLHLVGYSLLIGPGFVGLLAVGALRAIVGRRPAWVRTQREVSHIRRWSAVPAAVALFALVALRFAPELTLRLWLIPAAIAVTVVFPVFTLPEHHGGHGKSSLLDNTRTVESRLGRFVWWENSFHTAHHLAPTVPPCRLAEIDAVIAKRNTLRDRSFTAFWVKTFRNLPWV